MPGGLIKRLSLHKPLPTALRLDVWPFAFGLIGIIVHYFTDSENGLLVLGEFIGLVLLRLLAFLFSQWFVGVHTFLTCSTVKNVQDAKWVKVIPQAHKGSSEMCIVQRQVLKDGSTKTWFTFQKRNFIYNAATSTWTKIRYPIDKKYGEYHAMLTKQTYATDDALERGRDTFGANLFDIPMPTFSELYKEHALAPFFVFQIFCVALWCLDEYWYYSLFTLFMLLVFEAAVVKSRLYNLRVLRSMVQEPKNVNVYRKGTWAMLKSDQLLPGDIVSVGRWGEESTVPCELLLLSGTCVVNEAMLTGESTPQLKESIAHEDMEKTFDMKRDGKVHVLFGGTRLVQHSPDKDAPIKSPNNGCLGIVLRTGFETAQGKLMRTILFSTQRVTANTLETFFFILFLLCFAVAASAYVLKHGLADPERSRYKLLLECVLIITSVVPPELPMELSLAVNSSLIALTRVHSIFCTEPFRIPLAGKVDVCCFDKTGTLTTDHITLKGIAGVSDPAEPSALTPPSAVPEEAAFVVGGCHALVYVENSLVGDPMETAALHAIGWSWNRSDVATAKGGRATVRVAHRFHFSSSLRRMSAVGVVEHNGTLILHSQLQNFALCKGAPEVIEKRLRNVPPRYEETYKYWARAGCRVLALGLKEIQGSYTMHQLKALPRDEVESDLRFAGFLVFECPVKPDSEAAIDMLQKASHRVIMITGDNTLTACQVAKTLKIMTKSPLILTYRKETDTLQWQRLDESVHSAFSPKDPWRTLTGEYDLCISGDSLERVIALNVSRAGHFFSHVRVFARTSPDQKEAILTALKRDGMTTLMCGDGTNDVGALKQAHVGVALLNVEPNAPTAGGAAPAPAVPSTAVAPASTAPVSGVRRRPGAAASAPAPAAGKTPARPKQIVGPFGITINPPPQLDDGEVPMVRLGDASIASPFTAKTSSVMSIAHIIRQGRCTLVTTLQMFKILALNCLISAYSLSVLYLDGIKMGDTQATIVGMMIALCFLFLSHSKPLQQLSAKRPLPNIFSLYMFLSIIGQFAIHLTSLMFVVDLAKTSSAERQKPDTPFEPNLLNTCVFLISSSMQVSTFAINYKGHPFKDSLMENRKLLYCLLTPLAIVLLAATEIVPGFNWLFELVEFPSLVFRGKMLGTILLDFGASFLWEQLIVLIVGDTR